MTTAPQQELIGPLLKQVSRSFYLTLRVLPAPIRPQISLAYLLARATPGEGGGASFDLPLSKSELASRLGITPESLSRALKRLAGAGVTTHGRTVVIDDVEALRRFCRSE